MASQRPLLSERLQRAAQERAARAAVRRLRNVEGRDGTWLRVDGSRLLNFSSNDYLGLAQHPDVIAALCQSAARHGVGATAAHLVCGHHREHVALEEAIAEWLGCERALLFGSGYLANLAVLQALLQPGDLCVQDKLNHACLLDGARLSGCELKRYPHGDVEGARRQLVARPDAVAVLATDGVFSMEGDIAPLRELAMVARAESALLFIDDAHGVGVIGPEGRGSIAASNLNPREAGLVLVTLGKALGGYGAVIAGTAELIEAIVQTARPYLFTTALPPALAAASRIAAERARQDNWRRFKLVDLIARFREGAAQLGLSLFDSQTPIQPILVGSNQEAVAAAKALEARGVLVAAIRPPTVPEGRARLRVTLTAEHEEADVDRLLDALAMTLSNSAAAMMADPV